jgi:glutamine amidotransferase
MKVVIIQYNAGNTCSVQYALERLGIAPVITGDPDTILAADKVIFPGVGAAGAAMKYLQQANLSKPVLGICLGMQLLCSHSEEDETACLGVIDTTVQKFHGPEKIPQIGWNRIIPQQSPLLRGISPGSYMYYVHSYYVPSGPWSVATTEYILPYSAAIQKDNFYGVQFHPEKSGKDGATLLSNFLKL